jgi:hypothetical protein
MLAGYAVKLVCIAALYIYMYLENKRRDREAIDGQEVEEEGVENGMLVSFEFHGALIYANSYFLRTKRRSTTKVSDTFCKQKLHFFTLLSFQNSYCSVQSMTIERLASGETPRSKSLNEDIPMPRVAPMRECFRG